MWHVIKNQANIMPLNRITCNLNHFLARDPRFAVDCGPWIPYLILRTYQQQEGHSEDQESEEGYKRPLQVQELLLIRHPGAPGRILGA
jgi:hypothetical protein